MRTPNNGEATALRVYKSLRSAHLERLQTFQEATNIYLEESYDFDPGAASALTNMPRRVRLREVFSVVRSLRPRVIEINEAYQLNAWPLLFVVRCAIGSLRRRDRAEVVFYAIENFDPASSLAHRVHLPESLARFLSNIALRIVVPRPRRVCFGTAGSRDLYTQNSCWMLRSADVRLIEALPKPRTLSGTVAVDIDALFLGAFEERKGVLDALAAMARLKAEDGRRRFVVVGKGPLLPDVLEYVARGIEVIVDPPRSDIEQLMERAKVLILLSRDTPTWREQVGLPIVEALSAGMTVVSSDRTGLAEWLHTHGHTVLSSEASLDTVTHALRDAVERPLEREEVLITLPSDDARALADRWLLGANDA